MFSRLTAQGRGVPNLVIAQRVIDKIVAAAKSYLEDETGEAMIGLMIDGASSGIATLYILDTISPDETAVRAMHTFQQGDERQDELLWWLSENWTATRKAIEKKADTTDAKPNAQKWNVPLIYLGDWHKQPGYMIQPSGGDLMTALNWLDDEENGMDFLLAPIVTLDHPPTVGESDSNFITAPQGDGYHIRIDFWYIDRDVRLFLPITPTIYPNDQLPKLVEYPWHLVNEDRFETEMAQLNGDQIAASLVLWDQDNIPPLEVCLLTARVGSDKMLIITTKHDYPNTAPTARIAPAVSMGDDDDVYSVFTQCWEASTPVDLPNWTWTPETYLIDYVKAIEAHLATPKPAQEQESNDELG